MIDKLDKRTQILVTATHLFGKHGFHAVGVDWIIAKSNVSKMTMYRYFPSKADLVMEVLSSHQAFWKETLGHVVAAGSTPLDRLERIFTWYGEWYASAEFSGCLFAHAASEFADKGTKIHGITVSQKADLVALIEGILVDMQPAKRAKTLAPIIVMLLDGATLSAQITGNSQTAADAWSATRDLVGADSMADA